MCPAAQQPLGASERKAVRFRKAVWVCLSSRPANLNTCRSPGIILGPGNSTLFLERVTEEDEGVYRCRAANQKGAVESSAYLTVQGNQLAAGSAGRLFPWSPPVPSGSPVGPFPASFFLPADTVASV